MNDVSNSETSTRKNNTSLDIIYAYVILHCKDNVFMKIRIDPADTAFSKAIRLRDEFTCQVCGRVDEGGLQVHHIFGRRFENTRYEPDNIVTVCFSCHRKFHENPAFAVDFMKNRLGIERFNTLSIQANAYKKKDRKWSLIVAKEFLKLMEAENEII